MADSELATKAPESDAQEDAQPAQEQSAVPGDSKVDQGPASMGEHCTTDRPTPSGEKPTGEMTKFDDIDVYITKPADYPHAPSKLLLLLTGGTGVHSVNNQLQADKFAAEGFIVVVPDQFAGDPAPSNTASYEGPEENLSLLEQVKLGVASVAKSFTIDMWLARHTPEKVLPLLNRVLTSVKEEFADAVANGDGIYGAGYCFGARYILLLGSESGNDATKNERDAEEGLVKVGPALKVGAIAHGTQVSKEELSNVQVPLSIVAVENDSLFPEDVLEAGGKALTEKKIEHEVRVFPKVPHGFAVFGDYEDKAIVTSQKEAFDQMLGWLKSH